MAELTPTPAWTFVRGRGYQALRPGVAAGTGRGIALVVMKRTDLGIRDTILRPLVGPHG